MSTHPKHAIPGGPRTRPQDGRPVTHQPPALDFTYDRLPQDLQQQLRTVYDGGEALKAVIEKWQREATGYAGGAMMETPVGDMNRACAASTLRVLADLRAVLADIAALEPKA